MKNIILVLIIGMFLISLITAENFGYGNLGNSTFGYTDIQKIIIGGGDNYYNISNITNYYNVTINLTNLSYYPIWNPYSFYNSTTLPNLNSTGLIINWSYLSGTDWNATGLIQNWNSTGYIRDWSFNLNFTNNSYRTLDNLTFVGNANFTDNVTILGTLIGGSPIKVYGGMDIQTGNVTASDFIIGNGSFITDIYATNLTYRTLDNYTFIGNVSSILDFCIDGGNCLSALSSTDLNATGLIINWSYLTGTDWNLTGLIRDWNISGWIRNQTVAETNWNASGYIRNWGISDWNSSGLIRDWNTTGYLRDWNVSGWIRNQTTAETNWNSTGYIKNWALDTALLNTTNLTYLMIDRFNVTNNSYLKDYGDTATGNYTIQDGYLLLNGTIGSTPTSGIGTRLMWIPKKSAFRAGYVYGTQWNDVNIGNYSVAMGYSNIASGDTSTALGYSSQALGLHSTSIGDSTFAIGEYATSLGYGTNATGDYAIAMGISSYATGASAIAIGDAVRASGSNSIAIGDLTTASGIAATSMGYSTIASGFKSFALGQAINVSGTNSFGIGLDTTARLITANNILSIMGGNVGIGTVAPNNTLHVFGTINASQILVNNSALMSVSQWNATNTTYRMGMNNTIASNMSLSSNLAFMTNGTANSAYIYHNGTGWIIKG